MSDITPNIRLPYIMPAQAQKHVTHNEAIRALDALVQLSVASRTHTAPPTSPGDGVRYIVPPAATGAWTGQAACIAAYQDATWVFFSAQEGWLAWVQDEDLIYAFDGAAWVQARGSLSPVPFVGINASADTTNRLVVSAPASLFSHDGTDHRQKVNKAAAGNTASLLFQTAYSGRAEMGLTGDDNFHVKVSPDGAAWKDALVVDHATGAVSLPFTSLAGGLANPWVGRKWTALGTSITQQGNYTAPLQALLSATLTNLGVTGGRLSGPASGGGLEITNTIASIPSDVDLVTLEAGINDFRTNCPLGAIADTTTASFYGALHKCGTDILGAAPQRTLVFLVMYSTDEGSNPDWNTPNSNGNTLQQFQQAVRDVARKLGCPCIDVGGESGIGAQTASLYLYDGVHVNAAGGQRYAQFVYDRLLFVRPPVLQVTTPTFSPVAGTYSSAQSVAIACATAGATIYYTTDGTTPTTASPVYGAAITLAAASTVKALAVKSGAINSTVASAAYAIAVATPTFSPAAGTYASTQAVTIACTTPGASIYYTTDGTTPTTSSPAYSGPISIAATTIVTALAVKSPMANSAIASAAFTISGGFTPASLSPALWFDASDLSTLWQDPAATSGVTADGQGVARLNDKSGNGRHISQGTSAARPLYKTDGTLRWLQFDGSDDRLQLAATYTTPSGSWAAAWVSRKFEGSGNHSVVAGTTGTGDWMGDNVLGIGHPILEYGGGASMIAASFGSTAAVADHVALVNVSSGTATWYHNGIAGITSTGVTTISIDGLTFSEPTFIYQGRVYQFIMIPRALTSQELSDLTAWLKAKGGI